MMKQFKNSYYINCYFLRRIPDVCPSCIVYSHSSMHKVFLNAFNVFTYMRVVPICELFARKTAVAFYAIQHFSLAQKTSTNDEFVATCSRIVLVRKSYISLNIFHYFISASYNYELLFQPSIYLLPHSQRSFSKRQHQSLYNLFAPFRFHSFYCSSVVKTIPSRFSDEPKNFYTGRTQQQ